MSKVSRSVTEGVISLIGSPSCPLHLAQCWHLVDTQEKKYLWNVWAKGPKKCFIEDWSEADSEMMGAS